MTNIITCARLLFASLLMTFTIDSRVFAQSPEELRTIRRDLDELRNGQESILKSLRELTASLGKGETAEAPIDSPLNLLGAPFQGDKNAPLTIVEFTDYQCPFCARHAAQVLPSLISEFVKSGKVKYVIRDYPLDLHADAPKAAEAAYCAGEQGRYWEMHDVIFANQKSLGTEHLTALAGRLDLDRAAFAECLESGKNSGRVAASLRDAQTAGVDAAPTFYFALTPAAGSVANANTKLVGARPYSEFKGLVNKLISSKPDR